MERTDEGVIQFDLRFSPGPPPPPGILSGLKAWRKILHRIGLIGRDPHRYGGFGYGNMSVGWEGEESPRKRDGFIITGSQTGAAEDLGDEGFVRVTACRTTENRVDAVGPIHPSSESLAHGAVYGSMPEAEAVVHAHSPEIWEWGPRAGIPATGTHALCGTPEMAVEIERLFRETDAARRGLFVMGGHGDGVMAFGSSLGAACALLIQALASALGAEE